MILELFNKRILNTTLTSKLYLETKVVHIIKFVADGPVTLCEHVPEQKFMLILLLLFFHKRKQKWY